MRAFAILVFAIVGFVSGSVLGIVLDGGFENPSKSLCMGLLGAVGLAILQWKLAFSSQGTHYSSRLHASRRRLNRRPRGTRQETEDSFNERMERIAANVQRTSQAHNEQSKMSLWIAEEYESLEPSPPKSIGIIRMLLYRIRRVLTGK